MYKNIYMAHDISKLFADNILVPFLTYREFRALTVDAGCKSLRVLLTFAQSLAQTTECNKSNAKQGVLTQLP